MSETETATQGGTQAVEPAATTVDPIAPGTDGAAATETTTETHETEKKPSREDRRWAVLSARFSAAEQDRSRLAAENAELRRRGTTQEPERPLTLEDMPRIVEERVAAEVAKRETVAKVTAFHDAGRAAFPDWTERCQNLMQMGADAGLAELLVETKDGAKVAAALAEDPEELERIAGLRTERARAIALGAFAASIANKPAPAARRVSAAPAPIRALNGASARAEFDEYKATPEELSVHYAKQLREKRGLN